MSAARTWLVAFVAAGLTACSTPPRSSLDCTEELVTANAAFPEDAAFNAMLDSGLDAGLPGLGLLVHDPKLGTWAGTRGFADLATHTPLKTCHRFPIGSITKMFTTTAVLQLVEEGKLGLDDRLAQHLPADLLRDVANADTATIRQALGHTTGIANFTDLPDFSVRVLNDPDYAPTPRQMVRLTAGQPAVAPVGSTFSYSNTNFELLGLIVEAVTGQPLGEVLAQRLFEPQGMAHTLLPMKAQPVGPGGVSVYSDVQGAGILADGTAWRSVQLAFSGGAESTLADLSTFLDRLLGGAVLSPATVAQQRDWRPFTPGELASFKQETGNTLFDAYGLGIIRSTAGGFEGHSGSTLTATALLYRFPASGRTMVLFTNSSVRHTTAFRTVFEAAVKDGTMH